MPQPRGYPEQPPEDDLGFGFSDDSGRPFDNHRDDFYDDVYGESEQTDQDMVRILEPGDRDTDYDDDDSDRETESPPFTPEFAPGERLATPEELVVLHDTVAAFVDAGRSVTIFGLPMVDYDGIDLPFATQSDGPNFTAIVSGERIDALAPDLADRLQTEEVTLTHHLPFCYDNSVDDRTDPAGTSEDDLARTSSSVTVAVKKTADDPSIETVELSVMADSAMPRNDDKHYVTRGHITLAAQPGTTELASAITHTDYRDVMTLVKVLSADAGNPPPPASS